MMDFTALNYIHPPRFETGKPLLIAGIGERYTCESSAAIPGQWQRFHQSVAHIPQRVGQLAYGVCCNGDDSGNLITSPASKFPTSPTCLAIRRVRIPDKNTLCLPTVNTSRPFAAPSTRSGITGCRPRE